MMRYFAIIMLFVICLPVWAAMPIETINLHYRSAQEIIPIIKPLLDKDGSITGTGYKLFIKSSPGNIAQLRHMIGEIDVAVRNLLVSVSMDPAVMQSSETTSARIQLDNGNSKVEAGKDSGVSADMQRQSQPRQHIMYDIHRIQEMHTQRAPAVQTVRVSEGLWATIRTGQGVPIATRIRNPDGTVTDTYTYQAVASGFQVLPRVNGDTVTLTIRPQDQTVNNNHSGTYDTTEMETTVSGKLGQWIALGGISKTSESNGAGITYETEQRQNKYNQIYVKVELAKP